MTNETSIYVFYAEEASVGIKTMRKCVPSFSRFSVSIPVLTLTLSQIHRHS